MEEDDSFPALIDIRVLLLAKWCRILVDLEARDDDCDDLES